MGTTSLYDALPARIETIRLMLDAPLIGDLDAVVELANDEAVVKWTTLMPFPYGRADGEQFLTETAIGPTVRPYAIRDRSGSFMGIVSVMFHGEMPELGYWLGQKYWGQGLAGEAVAGLLAAVRELDGDHAITARVLADNPRSIRVLEKAGFDRVEETHSVAERHLGKPLLIMGWSARR